MLPKAATTLPYFAGYEAFGPNSIAAQRIMAMQSNMPAHNIMSHANMVDGLASSGNRAAREMQDAMVTAFKDKAPWVTSATSAAICSNSLPPANTTTHSPGSIVPPSQTRVLVDS